jgi:hypothetical protein
MKNQFKGLMSFIKHKNYPNIQKLRKKIFYVTYMCVIVFLLFHYQQF